MFSVLNWTAILLQFLVLLFKRESHNIISFSPFLLWIAFHSCSGLTQNLLTSLFPIPSASSNAMTQQLQDEFDSSVENAEAWMKAIQERLRINDNTKGPRSALEARLRETEVREEHWDSEVALTLEFSRRKLSAAPACWSIGPVWMGSHQHSFKFSICKLFTDVEKEGGNLLSLASKLFRLIWNTSSRFGRLKCLHSPQAWNNLVAACNYHSNLQTTSI